MTYGDGHGPITGDFGFALSWMKAGARVRKVTWRGTKRFLVLVREAEITIERGPMLDIFPAGTKVLYREHIDIYDDDGMLGPYIPNTADLTSEDKWEALPAELPSVPAPAPEKAPDKPLHPAPEKSN